MSFGHSRRRRRDEAPLCSTTCLHLLTHHAGVSPIWNQSILPLQPFAEENILPRASKWVMWLLT